MTRTFVVGLDGASWELIEPWIENGDLPNLKHMRDGGSWAESRSCLPPVTFPNWKCYSSGKNPGKFGVFWFEHIDLENEKIEIPDRRSFKTAELWDYLNKEGYSTGVVNMPTMFPPREIDGLVVCGGPDAVDGEYRSIESGYTYPEGLRKKLEEQFDYRVHPDPLVSSNGERGREVEVIHELIEKRFEVAVDLFEEEDHDFMHVTIFYLNVLQHFFWDEEPTKQAWKIVDEWLGRINELDNTNLVVMSDHGCAPTTTEFYVNEWLANNGYLTKKKSMDDFMKKLGLTRENTLKHAKRLGIVELLSRIVPEKIQKMVPLEAGAKRERKLKMTDLVSTKALASGQGPVYINPDYDVEEVREELVSDLKEVSDVEGSIFDGVYRGEEVYNGDYVDMGPDIVLDQREGVHINDGLGGGEVMTEPVRWAAENVRTGIFVANGPDFENQGQIEQIEILDIAPTILASFGVDIPRDMDGEVLSIFESVKEYGHQDSLEIDEDGLGGGGREVEDRLKQLGYME